jgi:murein DD-endopeptidase MepM/ murein hydrolase activator NlpD
LNPAKELRIYTSPIIVKYELSDRFAYTPGRKVPHTGIDLVCSELTDIIAPTTLKAIQKGFDDMSGNWIIMQQASGLCWHFAHMHSPSELQQYEVIQKGDLIGNVGHTGNTPGGPHLHFGVSLIDAPIYLMLIGLNYSAIRRTYLNPEWFVVL